MNKIALFILYNHHFTKNIDRIEELYKGKFSYVYHLIPFYSGDKDNVITVYESSYQFQSYIAQAYQQVKKERFTHYFVIADDMIINPKINENNLFEFTGIPENFTFITDYRDNVNCKYKVPLYKSIIKPGVEVDKLLPQKKDAYSNIRSKGGYVFPEKKIVLKFILYHLIHFNFSTVYHGCYYLLNKKKKDVYPILWGYSDILIIPHAAMDNFCLYCGAFAALNLFVEYAIPTSIFLSSDNIIFGNQLKLKFISQLYNLGEEGQKEFENHYKFSLDLLIKEYPSNTFFIHPIKLSKWK